MKPEAAWATTAFVIDEVCRQLSASMTTFSAGVPEMVPSCSSCRSMFCRPNFMTQDLKR
jgi:hypothetical protein